MRIFAALFRIRKCGYVADSMYYSDVVQDEGCGVKL